MGNFSGTKIKRSNPWKGTAEVMKRAREDIICGLILVYAVISPVTCIDDEHSVITPKIIEARLNGEVNFHVTYTLLTNSINLTISKMTSGLPGVVIVQNTKDETEIDTESAWTDNNNVEQEQLNSNTWNVSITLKNVTFLEHDGMYRARITSGSAWKEDFFQIKTVVSPQTLRLTADKVKGNADDTIKFKCSGNTGRPKPVIYLLREETFRNNSISTKVMSDRSPNITFLENGTYYIEQTFKWTLRPYDNGVRFRCDIGYTLGIGTELGSAISNVAIITVVLTKNIQIQAHPTTVEPGVHDVDIICSITSPKDLQQVFAIQLKKNKVDVFSVTGTAIAWQDEPLQTRAGVSGTGNTSTPSSAHLRIIISKHSVRCSEDTDAVYMCTMSGQKSDGSSTEQETSELNLTVKAVPSMMKMPSVGVVEGRPVRVSSVLEISCTGEIGSNPDIPYPSIRWCVKAQSAPMFTGLSIMPTESQLKRTGCQYIRSSSLIYKLTLSDTSTQVLCESGYSSRCGTGTAKQYLNLSTVPSSQQLQEGASFLYIIIGCVAGAVAVVSTILLLIYFCSCRRKPKESQQ